MFALFFLCIMLFLSGPLSIVPALIVAVGVASLVVFTINKIRTGRKARTTVS